MGGEGISLIKTDNKRYDEYYIGINEAAGAKVIAVLDHRGAGGAQYTLFKRRGDEWKRTNLVYFGKDKGRCLINAAEALNKPDPPAIGERRSVLGQIRAGAPPREGDAPRERKQTAIDRD